MSTNEVRVSNRKGRPNYPRAYKREVAQVACAPDVTVSKVALAYGLNTNMVFKWRRELRAGLLGNSDSCALVPVTLPQLPDKEGDTSQATPPSVAAAQEIKGSIEIELSGARVRVHGMVDPNQLRLVLRCLMPV